MRSNKLCWSSVLTLPNTSSPWTPAKLHPPDRRVSGLPGAESGTVNVLDQENNLMMEAGDCQPGLRNRFTANGDLLGRYE